MEQKNYGFEDFLATVDDDCKGFATQVHNQLTDRNYKIKVELKATGYFISYSHPKTKHSFLNLLFRKKGLVVRLYADNCNKYEQLLNSLPDKMVKEIEKASVCKRLINPQDCNPKCVMGYDFVIKDKNYKKCRYSCFQFAVDAGSIDAILAFVDSELKFKQQCAV